MFNQNFYADTNQDDSRPQFSAKVHTLTEVHPDEAPDDREYKRYDTDDQNRESDAVPSLHAGTGKGDTHGQGIDAGRYGQCQNHQQTGRVEMMFLFVMRLWK